MDLSTEKALMVSQVETFIYIIISLCNYMNKITTIDVPVEVKQFLEKKKETENGDHI